MTTSRFFAALCALALVTGCGSDDETSLPKFELPPPDAAGSFVPDAEPSPGSLYLRERSLDAEQLVLDIVSEGNPPLYGVAFRLETEAGVVDFDGLVDQTPFAGGVAGAVEARPGLVVVTFSRVGAQAPVSEAVIGAIRLKRSQPGGAPVRFVAEESRLFDAEAEPLAGTTFVGGTLVVP